VPVVHVDFLGVSSLQVQMDEKKAEKEQNQKLSDLLTVKAKEITELKYSSKKFKEKVSTLHQKVQGEFLLV